MSSSIIFAGLLIILGHAFKVLFDKTRIPDVIPMVMLGVIAGPVLGLVTVDNFGIMGDMLGTLALSIILFYSGLEINLETATKSLFSGTKIAFTNFLFATGIGTLIAATWVGCPFAEALAVGAMLGGTSFAIVIPLANSMKISDRSKTILLLESTFTDVLCIVVTLGIFQMIRLRELNPGFITGRILASFIMSAAIGAIAAFFWATVLRWVRKLENDMLLTPAVIVTIFGLTEFLGYSGAISSLAFGVVSGNIRQFLSYPVFSNIRQENVTEFNTAELALFSELVFILKIFFFFFIGISIRMANPWMALAGLLLTLLVFVARVLSARFALNGTLSGTDKAAIAIMGPKGLVSAVLLSLAVSAGFGKAGLLQELVYSTILCSIVFSAAMAFVIERGLAENAICRMFEGGAASSPQDCAGK